METRKLTTQGLITTLKHRQTDRQTDRNTHTHARKYKLSRYYSLES